MGFNNLEIEKKYLISKASLPKNLNKYKHKTITQGYISFKPVIRVRQYGNAYYLTLKDSINKSNLTRIEHEIKISKKDYNNLLKKCEGIIIRKERYIIPYKKYKIELDVFKDDYKGLHYAEVEFENEKDAKNFVAPNWFTKDVTNIKKYNNASLAKGIRLKELI